jgi:hypothetical protein
MSDPKAPTAPAVTLSAEQLQEMLMTMARELRKPADKTPEQLAEIEQSKNDRKATAQLQLRKIENKMAEQKACPHRRKDRTSCCVYEYMGAYLICQACQGIIHAGTRPEGDAGKETSTHIYDTRMFNEHFVETQAGMTTF